MNEDRLSHLLNEFAAPLTADNLAPIRRRPSPVLRWGLAGAALAAASVAAFVFLPALATAATLHRIEAAIKNAQTMVVTMKSVRDGQPKGRIFSTTWYRDGKWREEIFPGSPLAKTYILRDGLQYIYSPKHSTLTEEALGQWWYEGQLTGLDFAKVQTDEGLLNNEREAKIETRPKLVGREVYAVVMSRENDPWYHSEILVDKKTDLPIRAETETGPGGSNVAEYQFNVPVGEDSFDPKQLGLPVQNLVTLQAELMRRWRTPLATTSDCQIRNLWQSPQGDVFMVYTCPKGQVVRPSVIHDDRGTLYLRSQDIRPGQLRGDTDAWNTFTFGPLETRIAIWAALEKPSQTPTRLEVGFTARGDELTHNEVGGATAVVDRAMVPVEQGATPFPPYSTALVLNDYNDQLAVLLTQSRAEWYRKQKDYEKELPWRWKAYEADRAWLPTPRQDTVRLIVRCLRDLGREAEADEVEHRLSKSAPATKP